jgi:D-alanyl-D-alanine carboxypeptidase
MRTSYNDSRRPAALRQRKGHPIALSLTIVALVAATSLFLSYANWKQQQDDAALKISQIKESARIDASVKATLAAKIEKAKKAEADAKAKAASGNVQLPNPSLTQTNTTICDVTNPSSITVIINKKHCFNPSSWAPSNLVSLNGFYLQSEAAAQLATMMNDATAADVGFSMSSAYRSYENQVATYNTWVATNGSIAAADTVSARPGYSEHQTGLAADFKVGNCVLECFGGSAQYQWLVAHAADYGFIERYPQGLTDITGYSPEAWHWRYVGPAVAKDMKAKGIQTLERYYDISGGGYAN